MFNLDGLATITLFGVKNDRSRSGFEVQLPPSSDKQMESSWALECYMPHTEPLITGIHPHPVFLSLRTPYQGIGMWHRWHQARNCNANGLLAEPEYSDNLLKFSGSRFVLFICIDCMLIYCGV